MGILPTYAEIDFYHPNLLVSIVLFIIFIFYLRRKSYRNFPKGPYSVPILGSVGFFKQYRKRRHLHIEKVRKQYGDIFLVKAGNQNVVFLNGYDVIREAFVTQSDVFSERPNWLNSLQEGLKYGKGLIWQDANKSTALRKFALKSLRDFGIGKSTLESRILDEVQSLSNVFREHLGKPLQPKPWLHKATTNIIHQVVFGARMEYNDEKLNNLLHLINEFFKGGLLIPRNFLPKWLSQLLIKDEREYKRKQETIENLKEYIFNHIADHDRDFDPENIRDFIDLYLEACAKKSEESNVATSGEIFRSILDLFLAGAETTATTLVWCLLYMAKYPDIQDRCFQEIDTETGEKMMVSISDKARLPYTEATLLEIQRLATSCRPHCYIDTGIGTVNLLISKEMNGKYRHHLRKVQGLRPYQFHKRYCMLLKAPVGVAHAASRDTDLMGYHIPKGTIVISNLVSCAMDPKVWKKPEMFEPKRFMDQNGRLRRNEKLIPFSIGPRMCLGDSMAKTEVFLIFSNLVKSFTFTKSDAADLDDAAAVREGQVIFSADTFEIDIHGRN